MSSLVYVNVLTDALQRKKSVLESILELTQEQQNILKELKFDNDRFMEIIAKKGHFIKQLEDLDSGFETIYKKVKSELDAEREKYKDNILKMQHLITEITNLSVEVQALEERNKVQVEVMLANRKSRLRESTMNNQGVSSYYRTMSNAYAGKSRYIDKKK